ncbi:MAG: glycoside hydrolase family 2 TIM barrel-domain containing protein, partial [Rhodoferax sp.]
MSKTLSFTLRLARALGLLLAAALAACSFAPALGIDPGPSARPKKPTQVSIQTTDGRAQLLVDGKPFYVRGAGLEFGNPHTLAANGGNAMRTWRTENGELSGQQVLDGAWAEHLYVAMGLEIARERHGFDYNNPDDVRRQYEEVKAQVLKHKDHPALIIWVIGNELNLNSTNPRVWNAVNDLSKMIHAVDKNHATMTALAGIGKELVGQLTQRAPDLDLIGIQMYADIVNLPRYLRESGWTKPYIVTEWGATGHWEVPTTAWGAPLENDSTSKADFYLQRFRSAIEPDRSHCLGSVVLR